MSDTDRVDRRSLDLNTLGGWIAKIGIPASFAFALLFQTNVKLDALIQAVNKLTVAVEAKK